MKIIIREYCEKLYVTKLDNLDEVDKFLEKHKLQKLSRRNKKPEGTYNDKI